MTLRLLGPKGQVPPSVLIDGICSKPFEDTCHCLDTLWPNALPVSDQAFVSCLVLQGLRDCHRTSLEGGQHLGHALSLSFSPSPGPWPPSPVLHYKRYWWLSGQSHLKRQQGPAVVAVVT